MDSDRSGGRPQEIALVDPPQRQIRDDFSISQGRGTNRLGAPANISRHIVRWVIEWGAGLAVVELVIVGLFRLFTWLFGFGPATMRPIMLMVAGLVAVGYTVVIGWFDWMDLRDMHRARHAGTIALPNTARDNTWGVVRSVELQDDTVVETRTKDE